MFSKNWWVYFIIYMPLCSFSTYGQFLPPNDKPDSVISVQKKYKKELQNIIKDPLVKRALDFIEGIDKETVRNQIALTELEAPPFKENKFGKSNLFKEMLLQYGIDSVEIDEVGNVIGVRKGTKGNKTIAIAGHLDTVFPEGTNVHARISNDTIYAPGISDDGRGLTTVLTLARVFNELEIQTENDILFIGDVGEEGPGDLRGMRYLFGKKDPKINEFISIEPGPIAEITNIGIGSNRYKVTFTGPGGHSWGVFGLANPIHAIGQSINVFVNEADKYTKKGGDKTIYNIGRIGGGTSVNSIPYSAWIEVDMRSVSQNRLEKLDSIFKRSIRKGLTFQNDIRHSGSALKVQYEVIGKRPSGATEENTALIQRSAATVELFGVIPTSKPWSTDSNIPMSMGIPAVTISGGGERGGLHSLNEWYYNKDGYKGVQRAFLILLMQAKKTYQ